MITNEMKADILCLYRGAECTLIAKRNDPHRMLGDVGTKTKITGIVIALQESGDCDFQIHAKPLSEITDEDIEKILELEGIEKCGDIEWFNDRFEICYFGNDGWETRSVYYDHLYYPSADFLRSKGYALPYAGLDLFTSGIAIPSNKNK